jgi:hypothetical protein
MNVGKVLRVHRVEPVTDPVPSKSRPKPEERKPLVRSAAAKPSRAA